jgi:hypothetical protein
MIIDAQNSFTATANGALTGDSPTSHSTATASTNVIDLGVNRDIGGAVTDDLFLLCEVTAAFTSNGSATLQVQYQIAPNNAGAPGTWATYAESDAIPVANLVQGYKFLQGRPVSPPAGSEFRFVRLNYVIGTATMTAGAIEAAFVPRLQHNPTYARGYVA